MTDFEKLGAFYLGKQYDLAAKKTLPSLLLYDSKDLCTHAVCVGMTGSGKTGLCLSLLEEAAIDGIPAICIDPKGDLGNLLLAFPELRPDDFRPWVDPAEAARSGLTVEELATRTAATWREGLASWGQAPERIARFRDAVDITLYTPGASAGVPLTVLRSFAAPSAATRHDDDALRERITAAAAGLLSLLGIEGDPLRSREHILIMHLLEHAWRQGQNVEMAGLIRSIQQPPFEQVGVMDLESFYPANDRFELAMSLNNLLASPAFAAWRDGEPLDIQRLLYTQEGKPRLAILSIAHLSDAERMFFVTLLLNEVVAWMRSQAGTSSLRALLYMDEVFGYFPPVANPPSKLPMLTLLKQARAYGLGVVLATQNPVDLDYKGLANAGTWFLGRLQTERDKARVLEGLAGASTAAGAAFDRAALEQALAGLGNRVFLMNNVHDDAPVAFQSRWALSYLRGPLTREQITRLMQEKKQSLAAPKPAASPRPAPAAAMLRGGERAVLPPGVVELFLSPRMPPPTGARLLYRPELLGEAKVHFVDAKTGLNTAHEGTVRVAVDDALPSPAWDDAPLQLDADLHYETEPAEGASFAPLAGELTRAKTYTALATQLKDHLYRSHRLELFKSPEMKKTSQAGEGEGEFRVRLAQELKEQRDWAVEKLRQKYATKLASVQEQIRKAEQRMAKEKEQASGQTMSTLVTFGASLLGAFLGRKLVSAGNMSKAASSVRSATRALKERQDIEHAEETVEACQQRLTDLEAQFAAESEQLVQRFSADTLPIEPVLLQPKKADILIARVALLWTPWFVGADGRAEPAA
jgi:hypothetical protein